MAVAAEANMRTCCALYLQEEKKKNNSKSETNKTKTKIKETITKKKLIFSTKWSRLLCSSLSPFRCCRIWVIRINQRLIWYVFICGFICRVGRRGRVGSAGGGRKKKKNTFHARSLALARATNQHTQYEHQFALLFAAQNPKSMCNQQLMEFASSLADSFAKRRVSPRCVLFVVFCFVCLLTPNHACLSSNDTAAASFGDELLAATGDDDYEPETAHLLFGRGYDNAQKFFQALMNSEPHKAGVCVLCMLCVCAYSFITYIQHANDFLH